MQSHSAMKTVTGKMSEDQDVAALCAWRSIFLAAVFCVAGPMLFARADGISSGMTNPDDFCVTPGITTPCGDMPVDIPEFDASFIYRFIALQAQHPFDRFAWRAFMAVNWPLDQNRAVLPDGYRNPAAGGARWRGFTPAEDVVSPGIQADEICGRTSGGDDLVLRQFHQVSGDVLVDQAGNYVLYQTRMNAAARNYIEENHLTTVAGRTAFAQSGNAIAFPVATSSPAGVTPGAMILKFAWRVLPDGTNTAGFYTQPARIAVAAADALDGQAACHDVTVGLVGLHIVQRIQSGNGDRWIWATFEHNDNVPLAANAREVNNIIPKNLFPDGCRIPASGDDESYHFWGSESATSGTSFGRAALWGPAPPFARDQAGNTVPPAGIVRCWQLFDGTLETNRHWQQALAGTVWQNYFLVGTQWVGNGGGEPFGVGEVPRFLSNTALESFIQDQPQGSCLGCHSAAQSDAGQKSDFTFLLSPSR